MCSGEELVYRASCNEGEANLRGSLARAERRSQDFSDFCRFLQFFKITGCLTGFSTVVISRSITGVNALPHAVPVVSLKSLTHSVVLRVCCLPISVFSFMGDEMAVVAPSEKELGPTKGRQETKGIVGLELISWCLRELDAKPWMQNGHI
ncbi:hypothetical protein F2Q68_00012719 [Brassica cretica]|uniref:Uncharacterized protein n=1 Tax=Brassica cretica TaxID=69181 RepID=A0A8S9HJZ2_BRACR|nr:hypothetical protein F2Q68_00012719 [Brassica cretica]